MSIRKTQRKNKTKQVITWPSSESYFTIDSLIELNPHMLTSSGSDITLRVRLNKAVSDENLVAVIGQKNCGKGRPQLVFSVRPVKQLAIDNAKNDGISLDMPRIMTVMEISTQTVMPVVTPITNITSKPTVQSSTVNA